MASDDLRLFRDSFGTAALRRVPTRRRLLGFGLCQSALYFAFAQAANARPRGDSNSRPEQPPKPLREEAMPYAGVDLRREFGAKGDGTSDDTAALQAFLDACASGHRRGILPAGTYMHSGVTLDVSKGLGGVDIQGSGAGATILKLRPDAKGNALTIIGANGFGNQARPRISNLTIDGSGAGLDGIHFRDSSGEGHEAGTYSQGADLRDVTIKFAGRDGLYVGFNVNAGQAFNLWVAHPGRNGVTIIGGADWRFTSSQFYGAQRGGVAIAGIEEGRNGAARIRARRPHGLTSGTDVDVWGLNGSEHLHGSWTVESVGPEHLELRGSQFRQGWRNSGWIIPVLAVRALTKGPDNTVRITTDRPHGLQTGDQVFIRDLIGPAVNGHWIVSVVSTDSFDLQHSKFSVPYVSGGTVRPATFGVAIIQPASNFFSDCTIYSSMIGISCTSNSGNIFKFTGGEINGNWIGGVSIASLGFYAPNSLQNIEFGANSRLKAGMYSDILLMNTGETAIIANQFVLQGGPSKSLVEAIAPTAGVTWLGNAFVTSEKMRPYARSALINVKTYQAK